jgi:hypothetical protein
MQHGQQWRVDSVVVVLRASPIPQPDNRRPGAEFVQTWPKRTDDLAERLSATIGDSIGNEVLRSFQRYVDIWRPRRRVTLEYRILPKEVGGNELDPENETVG